MMSVPPSHPRYESLMIRERLEKGWENGLVSTAGLFAHGRGEAFDYLLGETTQPFAEEAMTVSIAALMTAQNPVLSVNGNTAALAAREVVELSDALGAQIEVNLFYHTEKRMKRIIDALKAAGAKHVLGLQPDARIPGLDHARANCSSSGIHSADVVLVPLEDGDRTQALRKMGKRVIVIDLNPLSRSAKTASITIVDNVVRALPKLIETVIPLRRISRDRLVTFIEEYDNNRILAAALKTINEHLRATINELPLPCATDDRT